MVRSVGAEISSTTDINEIANVSRTPQRLIDATTSRPRTGVLSWNFSPSRRVMVQSFASASTTTPSAICGCACICSSMPNSVSNSKKACVRVGAAVLAIGSSTGMSTKGTNFNTPVPAARTTDGAASVAAAEAKKVRRRMAQAPGVLARMSSSSSLRNSAVTSGRLPNMFSNTGTPCHISMPSPSTVRCPFARACFSRAVSSGT